MPKKRHYRDALSRNWNNEEVADEMGLSSGEMRNKNEREVYKVRNAGQGQVPIRNKKSEK